jgi:hypothetical protein
LLDEMGALNGQDSSLERDFNGFAPESPLWGTLIGVKRGESHLFLRYTFSLQAA